MEVHRVKRKIIMCFQIFILKIIFIIFIIEIKHCPMIPTFTIVSGEK